MKRKKTTHSEAVRAQVRRLRRQVPFHPFTLTLSDGTHLQVRDPFTIAFDPGDEGRRGSMEFCLLSRETRFVGSFDNVSRVALVENRGKPSQAQEDKRR